MEGVGLELITAFLEVLQVGVSQGGRTLIGAIRSGFAAGPNYLDGLLRAVPPTPAAVPWRDSTNPLTPPATNTALNRTTLLNTHILRPTGRTSHVIDPTLNLY
jgi:hypothetical protein